MNKDNIILTCKENKENFANVIKNLGFQRKWIYNSEMLLICSIIKKLWLKNIIESWRARWHSTEILCKFFADGNVKIKSIDYDRMSPDSQYSENKLKNQKNLELIYWDSNVIIPQIAKEQCAVLIDGPKWEDALQLTAKLLENKNIKVVFIHDFNKNEFSRNLFDVIFNQSFCSDDLDFIENFKDLDKKCWDLLKNNNAWAPYMKKWIKMESYAATIAMVINDNNLINKPVLNNYLNNYKKSINFWSFLWKKLWHSSFIFKFLQVVWRIIKY